MRRSKDIVDIAGLKLNASAGEPRPTLRGRPWLAITFRCCRVYYRVYRNRTGTAYEGRCPKCHRPLRVPIGPGGTANRFFEAE